MLLQVLLYVYRLRRLGQRQSRREMASEGLRGELRLERHEVGWRGRAMLIAYLFDPGTTIDVLPRLEGAHLVRVREGLTLAGREAVPRGRKSVEHYRQTWVCTAEPVHPDRWPEMPRTRVATGFDRADDDAA
jgi:hypothetical protein